MNHYVSLLVTDGVCFQAIGLSWIYQPNSSQSFNDVGYFPGRLSTRGTTNTAASGLPHHADGSDHLSLLFILDKKGKLLSLFCFFFLGLSKWLKAATGGKRQPFFPLYGPCFPFSQIIMAVRNRLLTHRCVYRQRRFRLYPAKRRLWVGVEDPQLAIRAEVTYSRLSQE